MRYCLILIFCAASLGALAEEKAPTQELWYLMTSAKDFDKVMGVYEIREYKNDGQRRLDVDIEARVKLLFLNFDATSDFRVLYENEVLSSIEGFTRRSDKTSTISTERTDDALIVTVDKNGDRESTRYALENISLTEYELMLPIALAKFPEGKTVTTPTLFAELLQLPSVTWRYTGTDQVEFSGEQREVHVIERDDSNEKQTLWVDNSGKILAQIGKRAALVLTDEATAESWKKENL